MNERFAIRRLRIGTDGQMTFLSGSRADVEQTYRRSNLVSESDELREAERLIFEYIMPVQLVLGNTRVRASVEFGATLREWRYHVRGESGHGCSFDWLKARGKLPDGLKLPGMPPIRTGTMVARALQGA